MLSGEGQMEGGTIYAVHVKGPQERWPVETTLPLYNCIGENADDALLEF